MDRLCELIWDVPPEPSVFTRWSQGFTFSDHGKKLTLVQEGGGPCSVLAPVQAFLVKHLLFDRNLELTAITEADISTALLSSFTSIMHSAASGPSIILVSCPTSAPEQPPSYPDHLSKFQTSTVPLNSDLSEYVKQCRGRYGLLSFLYSVVMTRGIDVILTDLGPMMEGSLIHSKFGHSNQSLLNLMLTGAAVPNVFDGTRDLGGIELAGIKERSEVGYLTLLEALRFCQVGENLKCPKFPIWVIGSESHTTLLFSPDAAISAPSPLQNAKAAFDQFDSEGNGFIPTTDLLKVLEHLQMVTDDDYITFMRDRLDPDSSGIILFPAFLEEFFPGVTQEMQERQFQLFHYNGLAQSNNEGRVELRGGVATVYVEYNSLMDAGTAPTSILRVLRTKWPTIEIRWECGVPSID